MAKIPNLEAILFDLDGTLIDTDDTVAERLSHRLRPLLGSRAAPTARWMLMRSEVPGNILVTVFDKLGLDHPLMDLTDWLRRRRGVYPAHEFRLIPGVEEMVSRLEERYKLGIVTTRSRYHINQFLTRFPKVAGGIGATVGLQDTRYLKPNPAPLRLAAGLLGVQINNCLMVGDTYVDIKAGRRAGAWAAGVLCGFGSRSELERAGAHFLLESTADLTHLL